jgi:methylglyoxal synthase
LKAKKNIALVAHDNEKKNLLSWVAENKAKLTSHNLYATGTTGRLLKEKIGLTITALQSGPLGGDLQIGALITERKIDILVFFWDPLESQPHDPDVKALIRICAVWNIPIACNQASADFMFSSQHMIEDYDNSKDSFADYLNRDI